MGNRIWAGLLAALGCGACADGAGPHSPSQLAPGESLSLFVTETEVQIGTSPRRVLSLATDQQSAAPDETWSAGIWRPLAAALVAAPVCSGCHLVPVTIHVDPNATNRVLLRVMETVSSVGYAVQFLDVGQGLEPLGVSKPARPKLRVVYDSSASWLLAEDASVLGSDCRSIQPRRGFAPDAPTLSLAEVRRCVELLQVGPGSVHVSAASDSVRVSALVPVLRGIGTLSAVAKLPVLAGQGGAWAVSNAVAQVVESLRVPFSECYTRELREHADAAGTVFLSLLVDSTGAVRSTGTKVSGNLQSTGPCVRAAAASAHFMPPADGSGVVQVPVTFLKESRARCRN